MKLGIKEIKKIAKDLGIENEIRDDEVVESLEFYVDEFDEALEKALLEIDENLEKIMSHGIMLSNKYLYLFENNNKIILASIINNDGVVEKIERLEV